MEKPNLKTAEEWEIYEKQIANDPRNFALCRAHLDSETGDRREWGYRLLALREAARKIKPTMDCRDLKERQELRFKFYKDCLAKRRTKMERLRKNPNYKSKLERERLEFISECRRNGTPVLRRQISMVWDKSRGHAVAVDETIYPEKSAPIRE